MDELLEKKKLEIDALTKQLLTQPPATKIKPMEDFSVNLGSEDLRVGFLEIQKWREIKKRESKSEFEQTEDGKFKYPFKPKKKSKIFAITWQYFAKTSKVIFGSILEKDHICNFCQRDFDREESCKKHMLTHSEMGAVICRYCHKRYLASSIETHQKRCPRRKRNRSETDSDS